MTRRTMPGTIRRILCATACTVALFLTGCAYAVNRAHDLVDCVRISVKPQFGIGVQAKVTGLIYPSVGLTSEGISLGWRDRQLACAEWNGLSQLLVAGTAAYTSIGAVGGVKGLTIGEAVQMAEELPVGMALGLLEDFPKIFWSPPPGMQYGRNVKTHWYILATLMDFEVSGTAAVLNVRVGVNAAEVCDFVLGFAKLDIACDDGRRGR